MFAISFWQSVFWYKKASTLFSWLLSVMSPLHCCSLFIFPFNRGCMTWIQRRCHVCLSKRKWGLYFTLFISHIMIIEHSTCFYQHLLFQRVLTQSWCLCAPVFVFLFVFIEIFLTFTDRISFLIFLSAIKVVSSNCISVHVKPVLLINYAYCMKW